MRTVSILGATGSVGRNTVDLIKYHKDRFKVVALTGNQNIALLAEQAKDLGAALAVTADPALYRDLKDLLAGSGIEAAAGPEAVLEAASRPADWIMAAIVGMAGLRPTLAAIRQGGTVALANKEAIVSAGPLMLKAVAEAGTTLLPVDSEHNAVFQLLPPTERAFLRKVYLTASGGPFLRRERSTLATVTPAEAVRHPTWSMGAKISIDSATMMNKALEIIEAQYLFNLKDEEIDALIHPQSIVHALVEYKDGSILSHMGAPDMRTPIAHALGWPERVETSGQSLDLINNINITFESIDLKRFIALNLARSAMQSGFGYPTALNAANEVAVTSFLAGGLRFDRIEAISDKVLQSIKIGAISVIEDVFAIDAAARHLAAAAIDTTQ